MSIPISRLPKAVGRFCTAAALFALFPSGLSAQGLKSLESKHYRIHYEQKHERLAGEVLEISEAVWPTLARAYHSYDNYRPIEIFLTDNSDDANGNAIYSLSRVVIYAPHLDWVMRGRANWVGNVVTHELAHVFSLRRAAWLSAVDAVEVGASTYNREVNYGVDFAWVPLVAPNWYIEGIAQLEAEQHGYDMWDSQRDMIVRDAYFTKTLPSLGDIETFDAYGDWISAERIYNTGFAFLRHLRDRYGIEKVRGLADPKPIFSFSHSVRKTLGKSLPELYEAWKKSLAETYADFPGEASGKLAVDRGSFNRSLALSSDGRYRAWISNDNRRYALNWIFWEDLKTKAVKRSDKPVSESPSTPSESEEETGETGWRAGLPAGLGFSLPQAGLGRGSPGPFITPRPQKANRLEDKRLHPADRSDEIGSAGLEFNRDNTRLLTTRRAKHGTVQQIWEPFEDIWEYDFQRDEWHRLTWRERASDASYHPTENRIVYARQQAGTRNVAVLDEKGGIRQLTNFREGQQVYNPRFSPNGKSIWFTLGEEDKEAIVSIPADIPGFDPFAALKDSALFPDSLYLAKGETLSFFTPFKKATFADLRFHGDTLLWSSNEEHGVFNVYARVRGDSNVYRATRVRGQAREPLIHDGSLYYQGYRRQRFAIYSTPLSLAASGLRYPDSASAALPRVRPKAREYAKAADLEKGEYRGHRVAWGIYPYFQFSPRFFTDSLTTHFSTGLALTFGDLIFGQGQTIMGEVSRQFDLESPLDYELSYYGGISRQAIRHTQFSWMPSLSYGLHHSTFHVKDIFSTSRPAQDPTAGVGSTEHFSANIKTTYRTNQAAAGMPLPLNFYLSGRFWRQTQSTEVEQDLTLVDSTGAVTGRQSGFLPYLKDAPLHRHFTTGVGWSWGRGMYGTWLPTGGGFAVSAQKWWARYVASIEEATPTHLDLQVIQNKPYAENFALLADFDPWSIDFFAGGALSYDSIMSFMVNLNAGFFTEKFPMEERPNDSTASILVENPSTYLWPLMYKLGIFRLPGYPYSFYYQGRDILEGAAAVTVHTSLVFPWKLKLFNGLPVGPFSSLYRVQLALMADAGLTLNQTPDRLVSALGGQLGNALGDRQHNLLADVGARLSATFRLYHQFPMTAYAQIFYPVNDIQPEDLYVSDYLGPAAESLDAAADQALRKAYVDLVKQPRYFVGLQFGIF